MAYINLVDEQLARDVRSAISVSVKRDGKAVRALDGYMLYGHAPNAWGLTQKAADAVLDRWKETYETIVSFEEHDAPFATLLAARAIERGMPCGLEFYDIFDQSPYQQRLFPGLARRSVFPVGYSTEDLSGLERLLREGLQRLDAVAPQVLFVIDANNYPNREIVETDESAPEIMALTRFDLTKNGTLWTARN